jgi:poly(A) polymerase
VEAGGYSRLLKFVADWHEPQFPLKGADLLDMGATPGRGVGETLKTLEKEWIDSGFRIERDALLERAAQIVKAD